MVKQTFTQNEIPWFSEEETLQRWRERPKMAGPVFVYSSWLGGWTESGAGLTVGLDDHGFHRGDGVFEALRAVNRRPYLLEPHWRRMQRSMKSIGIQYELDFNDLRNLLQAGVDRYPDHDMLIRMFVTRGPGGFSTDPRECLTPFFYIVITKFRSLPEEKYTQGVRIGRSRLPIKAPWMAVTKSLNYLPNVMMKQEAIARGLDFVVSFDDQGRLGESSTENIIVLRQDGSLAYPSLKSVLSGCTMLRLFELLEAKNLVPLEREVLITEQDLADAQGAWMVGATLDAVPVREYEGKPIPVHPLSPRLRELIRRDQTSS